MRRALDKYYTPETATLALLQRTQIEGQVLECCAGDGAMSRVLSRQPSVSQVLTNDIDPCVDSDQHRDATDPEFWMEQTPDWVVSNPPFSCCLPIIVGAFGAARRGVAMLLRLSYLEPCNDRAEFLSAHPPSLIILPRISFTGDGKSDSVTCAWMVWDKSGHKNSVEIVTKPQLAALARAKYEPGIASNEYAHGSI